MADIKLGLNGSEFTLAHTITNSLPTDLGVHSESARMSDGTIRYAFTKGQRRWALQWVKLTAAQLATLVTISGYGLPLRYQNNDESATWFDVVAPSLAYDVINPGGSTVYYTAQMTIEELN